MAAPVAALAGIWTAIITAIAQGNFVAHIWMFATKLAIRLALFLLKVGALLVIIGVIGQGIQEVLAGINLALPSMLSEGIRRILPSNFFLCLSAIITAKLLVFAFAISSRLIDMFLRDF